MCRSRGFTFLELIIAIVILGAIGAVAVPKFLNLGAEAHESQIKSLQASIKSANTLAASKANIAGVAGQEGAALDVDGETIIVDAGRIRATADNLGKAMAAEFETLSTYSDASSNSWGVVEFYHAPLDLYYALISPRGVAAVRATGVCALLYLSPSASTGAARYYEYFDGC